MGEYDREISNENRAHFPRSQAEWEKTMDALEIASLNEARYKAENERLRDALASIERMAQVGRIERGDPEGYTRRIFEWIEKKAREALKSDQDMP